MPCRKIKPRVALGVLIGYTWMAGGARPSCPIWLVMLLLKIRWLIEVQWKRIGPPRCYPSEFQ